MIDTLLKQRSRFQKPVIWDKIGLEEKKYIVLTLHRPANVDEEGKLKAMMDAIIQHSRRHPPGFSPYIQEQQKYSKDSALEAKNLFTTEPLGYLEFQLLG